MLLKSFFRKKTIRNYFIIFLLTFTLMFSSVLLKRFYIVKQNELYDTSYIYFNTDGIDINEIKHEDIKDVVVGLWLDNDIFVKSDKVSDDEIIVYNKRMVYNDGTNFSFEEVYQVNDNFPLEEYNLNLRIKEKNKFDDLYYISSNNYEKIKNSGVQKVYIVTLKSYFCDENKVEEYLQTKFNITTLYKNNAQGRKDYLGRISMLNIFMVICLIFFGIVFIITLINIFIDEQKTNHLYFVIGYNKVRIFFIFISKLITLLVLPLVLSACLSFLIYNLFKIFV